MKHYAYVLEIAGLFALITFINFIWARDNLGFIGTSPHPYWIIVLGISVKYQLRQAGVAVFTVILAYSLFLFFSHNVSFREYFAFEYFSHVLLFMVLGGLIGMVRSSQNQKFRKLQIKNEELTDQVQDFKNQYDEMVEIKNELSERLLSHTSSFSTIYKLAKKINIINVEQLIPASLDIIVEVIGADKCSFHKLENDQLELRASVGWDKHDDEKYADVNADKLVSRVLNTNKMAVLTDLLEQEDMEKPTSLEGNIIMSAPVTLGQQKKIYGILNIEKMPFMKFSTHSINVLSIIADWISDSVYLAIETKKSVYAEQQASGSSKDADRQMEEPIQTDMPMSEIKKD